MFSKLAFKNAARSMKDYLVYFLTLMFGVCLFYMFNSIDAQTVMLKLSSSQTEILKSLTQIIGYVSVFISVILGFLVVYANGFLMKRRKKELGIYMTLGMPRSRISVILILETFLIGLFSLAAGLVAGIFLSQGMSVVTAKLFEANLSKFIFTFSQGAFWKTLIYFGVIFLVVMVFNTVSVSRLKLIDLLSAAHKNERLRIHRLWISVAIFLVSVGCLAAAYYLIETNGMFRITPQFIACLILGIVGTLLFFLSLSGFLLRVVKSNRKMYFKNLNMFVLRQFNSRINTTFVSISVICIMLLMTIGTLSTGMSISNAMTKDLKTACPYDATLSSYGGKVSSAGGGTVVASGDRDQNILNGLQKADFSLSKWSDRYAQVSTYLTKGATYGLFFDRKSWPKMLGDFDVEAKAAIGVMSVSDFNKIMQMQGKQPLSLAENQYAINSNVESFFSTYDSLLQAGKKITLSGKRLEPLKVLQSESYYNNGAPGDIVTLILPDSFLAGQKQDATYLNIYFRAGVDNNAFLKALDTANTQPNEKSYDSITTKKGIYERAGGSKMIATYLALYIGLVFLIAAAAVLALQQLSESSDNVERYGLLRKLGAEESMVNHALFTQIALYFLLPLSLAIIHSIVGIHAVNKALVMVNGTDMLGSIFATAAIFVVVYGAYFLATYFGSKSMIHQKEIYRRTE